MSARTNCTRGSLQKMLQQTTLQEAERKFQKSCSQIILLNKQLEDVQERYRRAKRDNFRCYRYNLRLKLAVIEGVRNMFYEYAHIKAEEIAELRLHLFDERIDIVAEETTDTDSDGEEI